MKTLKTRMEEGSYEQFVHLWSLYGKILLFFFYYRICSKAINKEPLLLETKGGIPFLENACCNNGEPKTIYILLKKNHLLEHIMI